jgi:hypothetical protein
MEKLTPEQIAVLTPEAQANYFAALAAEAAATKPAENSGSDILARLNASSSASNLKIHKLNLKVESLNNAQPTKTGLPRRLVKFEGVNMPLFVLSSVINGSIKEGNTYAVEMTEKLVDNKTYFNVISIKGDRNAAFDTFDYLLQQGDKRAAFSLS